MNYDATSMKTKLLTNETLRFDKKSFFKTLIGIASSGIIKTKMSMSAEKLQS